MLALYEIAKATSGVQSRIQLKESAESHAKKYTKTTFLSLGMFLLGGVSTSLQDITRLGYVFFEKRFRY